MTARIDADVLILAAGRGRRAGGPKAWRPYQGKTLLEAHLDFFRGLVGAGRVRAAIQEEWRGRCQTLSSECRWVAADPDASPLDSLRRLIPAASGARAFVLHVDMPVFNEGVYRDLLGSGAPAAVPTFGGRRGHPILLSARSLEEISRLDPMRDRLDAWLHARGAREVPVASETVLLNLNEA